MEKQQLELVEKLEGEYRREAVEDGRVAHDPAHRVAVRQAEQVAEENDGLLRVEPQAREQGRDARGSEEGGEPGQESEARRGRRSAEGSLEVGRMAQGVDDRVHGEQAQDVEVEVLDVGVPLLDHLAIAASRDVVENGHHDRRDDAPQGRGSDRVEGERQANSYSIEMLEAPSLLPRLDRF